MLFKDVPLHALLTGSLILGELLVLVLLLMLLLPVHALVPVILLVMVFVHDVMMESTIVSVITDTI